MSISALSVALTISQLGSAYTPADQRIIAKMSRQATGVLHRIGISGEFTTQLRSPIHVVEGSSATVVIDILDGLATRYEVCFDRTEGEIIEVTKMPRISGGHFTQHSATVRETRVAALTLEKLGLKHTKIEASVFDFGNEIEFFFYCKLGEYPFVSRFGGSITLTKGSFEVTDFNGPAPSTIPKPNASTPIVSLDAAKMKLKAILDRRMSNSNTRVPGSINTYFLVGEPELAFFQIAGQTKANLVWYQPYGHRMDVKRAIHGGGGGVIIDALSGEEIHPPYAL